MLTPEDRRALDQLWRELDRHAAELILRAANLDYLAGVIEVRMVELDKREHVVASRENDALMASRELRRRYKQKEPADAPG